MNHTGCSFLPSQIPSKGWRKVSMGIVGSVFKLMSMKHNINLINKNKLIDSVFNRNGNKPMITIMNHASVCDDTFILGHMLPVSVLLNTSRMRWTLTASDVCFTSPLMSKFFMSGQCIPVWRNIHSRETGDLLMHGLGVNQPSMNYSLDILNSGGWINLYPQGKIVYGFETLKEETLRLKWGVGRLISECKEKPIIIPLWHCGMEQICPVVKPYWFTTLLSQMAKKKVTIMIGDRIQLPDQLYKLSSSKETWAKITQHIQDSFYDLRQQTIRAHQKFLLN